MLFAVKSVAMRDTTEIRPGEELNEKDLAAYLRENLPEAAAGDLEIRQFPAGASNLTYLVGIGGEEFVLRRPPFGNRVKTAHDMRREFEVLSKLSEVYPPAPRPLIYCGDERVIGAEFYLMERRRGLIIRGKAPAELENSAKLRREVCAAFIENLVRLHQLDYKKAGLAGLGKPAGYARRQVEGWTRRYFKSKTDDWPELEQTISWLNQRIPDDDRRAALVHNDYKFDNIMLDPAELTRVTAVLDWEMTTIGSPLMDLGTTLGYWMSAEAGEELLSMPFNPRVLMEDVSRRELTDMYTEISGRELPDILYYYVFGTFKIAVIAQQIYYRYAKGFTADQRFAVFNRFVARLGRLALSAIQNKKI